MLGTNERDINTQWWKNVPGLCDDVIVAIVVVVVVIVVIFVDGEVIG